MKEGCKYIIHVELKVSNDGPAAKDGTYLNAGLQELNILLKLLQLYACSDDW